MARKQKSADELQEELNRVAMRLSADGEGRFIEFELPVPAEAETNPLGHNWDVTVHCPEGLEEIATNAVIEVAERRDLD